MKENIFLDQTPQQILNIVEALQFYKDNAIKPKYKYIIDDQLQNIGDQLKVQNINVLIKDKKPAFNFGETIMYENEEGIIIGMSNEDNFIKIVVCNNNKLETLDVPINLITKIC